MPSGDRTFARLVVAALERTGHEVVRPHAPSTWRAEPHDFAALDRAAQAAVGRIAAGWRERAPDAVLTYHSYHKAPDLVGPPLAAAFALPYAVLEASRAPRHARSPWAAGFERADAVLAEADAVGAVTAHDAAELTRHVPHKVVRVPPFLDVAPFLMQRAPRPDALACAAMMRPGRKAEGVRVLADALARVRASGPR